MTRWLTLIWILWLGVAVPLGAQQKAGTAKDWKQLKYPPLRDVKLPEIQRYTLSNGIRLFVVEDHRLPLVGAVARIRTGSRWEPAEKVGLASMVGRVMRTGGTRSRTGDELDEELEAMAASVETGIGLGSGSAGFSALKGDEDRVLAIFADVLMNPEFRPDKIELAKTFARTAISRRNDNPMGISGREFRKLVYGSESPYARHSEYATIDAIRRKDLIEFHRRYYHPNNLMIGISGDVDAEQIRQKVEAAFAGWKPAPELQLPPISPVEVKRRASVNFIRKEDVNQTTIRLGHLSGRRDDPDYFALRVMSRILASGPSSRIFKRIRTEMGLAYAARGFWGARYDHPGTFSVFVGTKSETTVEAIEAVLREVRLIREEEVTDEELQVAKDSILNSFVFNFADPGQIMGRIMTYIYHGYPEDFLQRYKNNVEKVTKADVMRVARKHLEPDRLTLLVVGNDKDFDKPLTELALAAGRVNTVDITIPEARPAVAAAPATAARLERGRAVLAAAQAAAGGLERLRAITDVALTRSGKVTTPRGEMAVTSRDTLVFPGVLRSEQTLPFGTMVSYYDGAGGWVSTPRGVRDLPDRMKKLLQGQLARNTLNLLRAEGDFTVQFEKREKVGETEANVILISKEGQSVRLFVDSSTGALLKKAYRAPSQTGGPADFEESYSEYREISGIRVPFRMQVTRNGSNFMEVSLTEVKFDTGVDPPDLAKKPQ